MTTEQKGAEPSDHDKSDAENGGTSRVYSATTSSSDFTVIMNSDLVNLLDECFSPRDGIEAIDQVFLELPRVHRSLKSDRHRRRPRKSLKLFRGRFAWFNLGFTYVQFNNELHVLDIWADDDWNNPDRQEVDSVVGRNSEELT